MAYKYPICDVFHWFCKILRFFATEPFYVSNRYPAAFIVSNPEGREGGLNVLMGELIEDFFIQYWNDLPKVNFS
jgi:hypothetical protein